jgi:hypothetical protein
MVVVLRESVCCVAKDDRAGCRHRFDRTWAKLLKNKGKFVVLVNGWLTPQGRAAIIRNCAAKATVLLPDRRAERQTN